MRFYGLLAALILSWSTLASDTLVGFSDQSIVPEQAIPLGGHGSVERRILPWDILNKHKYTTFFKPNEGKLDDNRVKAMVVRKNKKTLIFLSFDTVGMEGSLRKAIAKKLKKKGIGNFELIATATHTHHGPGGLSKGFFWQILAMDRFLPWYFNQTVNRTVGTIMTAIAKMEKGDVKHMSYTMPGFTRNRSSYHTKVDSTVNVLIGENENGKLLGGVVSLAMHPTTAPIEIMKFSADITGAIERELQTNYPGSTFLYVNGSVGDVSANFGYENWSQKSKQFVTTFQRNRENSKVINANWEVYEHQIRFTSKGHLNLGTCLKRKRLARWAKISLMKTVPRNYNVKVLKLDHLVMFLWPGEPTTILGLELKSLIKAPLHAMNFGLTGDHFGYFVSKREWQTHSLEACTTLTGPYGGRDLIEGFSEIVEKQINSKL